MRLPVLSKPRAALNLLLFVCGLTALAGGRQVWAQVYGSPYSAMEAMLKGQAECVQSQAALVQAQAALLKAQSDSLKVRAEAMETYQKARSAGLDNDLKQAKTYHEKRQFREVSKRTLEWTRQLDNVAPGQFPTSTTTPDVSGNASVSSTPTVAPAPTNPASATQMAVTAPSLPANVSPPVMPNLTAVQPGGRRANQQPTRLAAYQLDDSGRIRWPAVFLGAQFAEPRRQLEYLFANRSPADVGPTTAFYHHVYRATTGMLHILHDRAGDLSPAESIAARRFIEAMATEADFPMSLNRVVKN